MFDETQTTPTGPGDSLDSSGPLTPSAARAEVPKTIREFMQETLSWHARAAADRTTPAVLGLKVTASTGKTREMLGSLAEFAPRFLTYGTVVYFAPTLATHGRLLKSSLARARYRVRIRGRA